MSAGSTLPAANEPMGRATRPIRVVIVSARDHDPLVEKLVHGFARIAIRRLRVQQVEDDPMDLARSA